MKCFNHNDRDAFGVDVITGKGLCLECLELYNGLVIEKNNEKSKLGVQYWMRIYNFTNNKNIFKMMTIIILVTALLYFSFAMYDYFSKGVMSDFLFLPIIMFVLSSFPFVMYKIYKRKSK